MEGGHAGGPVQPARPEGGAGAGVGPEGVVGLAVVFESLAGSEARAARHPPYVMLAADEDVARCAVL